MQQVTKHTRALTSRLLRACVPGKPNGFFPSPVHWGCPAAVRDCSRYRVDASQLLRCANILPLGATSSRHFRSSVPRRQGRLTAVRVINTVKLCCKRNNCRCISSVSTLHCMIRNTDIQEVATLLLGSLRAGTHPTSKTVVRDGRAEITKTLAPKMHWQPLG